jgi:hypothetical protein
MKKNKLILGIILFVIGLFGIASLLTMDIPIPVEVEALLKEEFTSFQIKLITLVNPIMLLVISVLVGTVLYQKVNLKAPILEKIAGIDDEPFNTSEILKYGVLGGVLSSMLISGFSLVFNPILPLEFKELGSSIQPSLAARFLYGGFTEEILMRFGLMTFLVWLCSKIFRGTKPVVYWISIIMAAIIFAIGHFPVVFQAIENPSIELITYILIANSAGGIIFGWLYWEKGLESAFIAHIFAHVVMVLAEQFFI